MERLIIRLNPTANRCTKVSSDLCYEYNNCFDCPQYKEMVDRLAAYEDTGLEPEEVRRLQKDWASLIFTIDEMGGMPHLHKLVQAEKEGKIPRYALGDTVYDRRGMEWIVFSVELVECGHDQKWLYRCSHPGEGYYCGLYQDEVLTREEAEAALEGEEAEAALEGGDEG